MSLARKATDALGGDWHGDYGTAPSPGHGKADRGLSIRDTDDGADILVNSFNGADWQAVKDDLRDRGILPPLLREAPRSRESGRYEYIDESGVILYRTVRIEKAGGKDFIAQRPDGRGGWIAGIKGVRRIPYRLPELLAASPETVVYVVEGERKADLLAAWGFTATAVAFGANGGWRDDFGPLFNGRTVAILPDNDDPGFAFAEKVRASIAAHGGRPFLVQLPGLPPKGDVVDWKAAGGTADELQRRTDLAISGEVAVDLLPLIDPSKWEGDPPEREWAMRDWLPWREASYLTGAGATGKSLLAQQMCTCFAMGRSLLGVEMREGVSVYVTWEDDETELWRRQHAICAGLGVSMAGLSGRLLLLSMRGRVGSELAMFDVERKMRVTETFDQLRGTLASVGAKFVVLDNVAHMFGGDENKRHEVAAFVNLLNRLAMEMDGAVMFLGHPNKSGGEYSGSTAWENQVRSRLFLGRVADDDAGGVVDPDARVLSRSKPNYARMGENIEMLWHRWSFVLPSDLPPDVSKLRTETITAATENEVFMQCLAACTKAKRVVSHSVGPNYAPKIFAGMPEAKRIKQKAFAQALERLLHIGKIELEAELWPGKDRHMKYGIKAVERLREAAGSQQLSH
jgi:RecA-family ATPase